MTESKQPNHIFLSPRTVALTLLLFLTITHKIHPVIGYSEKHRLAPEEKADRFYLMEFGAGGVTNPSTYLLNLGLKYGESWSPKTKGFFWYEFGGNAEYEKTESSGIFFLKPEFGIGFGGGLILGGKLSVYVPIGFPGDRNAVIGIGGRGTVCFLYLCLYYSPEFLTDGRGPEREKVGIYFNMPICLDSKFCFGTL